MGLATDGRLTDQEEITTDVLSGQRVSQMTKTFEDVDALQRLLEEKEKDLELAARIGQQLLEQNRHLEEKVTALEGENRETHEELTQLKHDLAFKIQLLEIYNENYSEETSKAGTPIGSVASLLERRVANLEDENRSLRAEACRIVEDVEKTEAEEKILVEDAIKKLSESNSRVTTISDELQKKTEEVIRQQDEMAHIVDQLHVLQGVNKELVEDNSVLNKAVEALHGSRTELTTEIADLKENYVEIVTILKETQEQLREAQKQKEVGGEVVSLYDSLAFELESSVARQRRTSDYFRRAFDTVRNVNNKLQDGQSGRGAGMMSSVSSLGYQSMHSSSALPSLDSSHESSILNSSNPCQSLVRSGSDLGSSICPSLNGSSPGSDRYSWRMPEKLQIVKPLEGSSTLQVWSALATPNLGNLLDRRPGVKSRTERPAIEMGMGNMLSLTAPESTLPNVSSSTSTVFTFVTTSSDWNRRDSTSTVYSTTEMSTMSGLSMTPSARFNSPCPSACSSIVSGSLVEFGTTDSHLYLKCETPQNSPLDGNSFPGTPAEDPTADVSHSRNLPKTIYDALCKAFGSFGPPLTSASATKVTIAKKYDIVSKFDNFVVEDVGHVDLTSNKERDNPEHHQPHHYYRY